MTERQNQQFGSPDQFGFEMGWSHVAQVWHLRSSSVENKNEFFSGVFNARLREEM